MARVVKGTIHWDPVSDAAMYRLYVAKDPDQPDYSSPYIETTNTQLIIPDEDTDNLFATEGTYNLAVTALDAVGNESDLSGVYQSPFDFVAPSAPTGLGVTFSG